jgi:serine phosphatase RsbU (regulator of sigma subunit)
MEENPKNNKSQKEKDLSESFELANLETFTATTIPLAGDIPELEGYDIYGESIQKSGLLGGDHIIYIDFKKRYKLDDKIEEVLHDERYTETAKTKITQKINNLKGKGGILVADVSGHLKTDFSFAARLHDSFLISVLYEIEGNGDVTPNLFRKLNTRLYNSSSFDKFITLIYGEVAETGVVRFISAGHPFPLIFSAESNTLRECRSPEFQNSPPIAAFPSKGLDMEREDGKVAISSRFKVNELSLTSPGDILILYTDGLSEHADNKGKLYFDPVRGGRFQDIVVSQKELPAKKLFKVISEDIFAFSQPEDDLSFVLIKKT